MKAKQQRLFDKKANRVIITEYIIRIEKGPTKVSKKYSKISARRKRSERRENFESDDRIPPAPVRFI